MKRPRLSSDRNELRAKYDEMSRRQNGTVPDRSSKHVIAAALKPVDPDFKQSAHLSSAELGAQLQQRMTPEAFAAAQHALPKFEAMSPTQRQAYLSKGSSVEGAPKYGSKAVLPHNESLVQPRKEDVVGVLVSPGQAESALELQKQYASARGQQLPFMTYDNKTGEIQAVNTEDVNKMAAKR